MTNPKKQPTICAEVFVWPPMAHKSMETNKLATKTVSHPADKCSCITVRSLAMVQMKHHRHWISIPASPLLTTAMSRELERVSVFPGAAQGGKVGFLKCARRIAVGVGILHGWVSQTNVGDLGFQFLWTAYFSGGFSWHSIPNQPNFRGFT